MVRQVLPLLLWFYLQPILLSRLFLFLLPGRDTQEFIANTATSFITEDLSSLISYFSTSAWSLLLWIFSAGRVWLIVAVMPVVLLLLSCQPDGVSHFTPETWVLEASFAFPEGLSGVICSGVISTSSAIFYGFSTRASAIQTRTPVFYHHRSTTFDPTASIYPFS